jgi:ABC-type transporter Mla subunit MlaD
MMMGAINRLIHWDRQAVKEIKSMRAEIQDLVAKVGPLLDSIDEMKTKLLGDDGQLAQLAQANKDLADQVASLKTLLQAGAPLAADDLNALSDASKRLGSAASDIQSTLHPVTQAAAPVQPAADAAQQAADAAPAQPAAPPAQPPADQPA